MKKRYPIVLLAACIAASFFVACAKKTDISEIAPVSESAETDLAEDGDAGLLMETDDGIAEAPDYSSADSWMLLEEDPQREADLFYIYPTVYSDPLGDVYADVSDSTTRAIAQFVYTKTGSAIGANTNVYAPYYRQINLQTAAEMTAPDYEVLANGIPREDIFAALDIYFEKYNNGRPFILAGHSQGSCMIKIILEDYMRTHLDYLDRMVAAYAVGYSITEEWLASHPSLKFAEGPDDTGVIISWNTEGIGNADIGETLVVEKDALSINPISWTRNDTLAPAADNLGSRSFNVESAAVRLLSGNLSNIDDIANLWETTTPGIADAQINLERGTVVCSTSDDFNAEENIFGPESFHSHDYDFYYCNIMENAKLRIDTYLKNHRE